MLTNEQKKQLKAIGMTIKTKYQLGKNGITDNLIDVLNKALTANELIKVSVLRGSKQPLMEIALDLSSKLNAEVVQMIGNNILLFRLNKNNSKIRLCK